MELMKTITSKLDNDTIGLMGELIGADTESARNAIESGLPLLVAALGRNARTGDATEIRTALQRDHDGSVFGDLNAFLRNGPRPRDDRIVDHILGRRRDHIEKLIADSSGLSEGAVRRLLATLAPLVMGALARQHPDRHFELEDLLGILSAAETDARQQPGADALADLLDGESNDEVDMERLKSLGTGLLGKFRRP